ncbi:putative endonuclease [Cohaesibacter sp. ES.047]|nr:putative endonuclease [Cohaesibacter sp. ES.047]
MVGERAPKDPKQRQRARSYDRGVRAERWAGWIMATMGFAIIERRYKAQGGEIDLICQKEDLLVFLEVKYRASIDDALHSITPRNQGRIIAAANHFLANHALDDIETYRFDVMAFARGKSPVPVWQHLESAFELW